MHLHHRFNEARPEGRERGTWMANMREHFDLLQ